MPDNDPVTTAFQTSDSGVVHVVSRPTPGHRHHRAAEYGLSGTSYLRPTRKRARVKRRPAKASIAARLGAPQPHWRLPMAQHRESRQRQIQALASALAYDVARFLKGPVVELP